MNNEEYLLRLRKKKIYRIMAWVGLTVIFMSVAATIVTAVIGSRYFIACLASSFIISLLVYAMLFVGRVLFSVGEGIQDEAADEVKDKDKEDKGQQTQ